MAATLPPPTDAHRRAAFERLAMRGWTFAAACADPLRQRVIEALAAQIRTAEWKAWHARRPRPVRRFDPATGRWRTQRVPGAYDLMQPELPGDPAYEEPTA